MILALVKTHDSIQERKMVFSNFVTFEFEEKCGIYISIQQGQQLVDGYLQDGRIGLQPSFHLPPHKHWFSNYPQTKVPLWGPQNLGRKLQEHSGAQDRGLFEKVYPSPGPDHSFRSRSITLFTWLWPYSSFVMLPALPTNGPGRNVTCLWPQ